jgi:hypothetical protein
MSSSNEELLKTQFFYNYASNLNSIIFQAKNRLYNKIKDITAIIIALIPILFGMGYYCLDNSQFRYLLFPLGATMTCFFLAVIIGFYIISDSEFIYNDPLTLIQEYHLEDTTFITLKTASSLADVVNVNCAQHNITGERYKWMLIFVGIGIVVLLITFLQAAVS